MSSSSQPRSKKLDSLTSLRFVAAAAIVLEHARGMFPSVINLNSSVPFDYGVSFFFVLSGFILTYVYNRNDGAMDIREFAIARIARIWPLHVVTLLMCIVVLPRWAWGLPDMNAYRAGLANLFLVQSWIPVPAYYFSYNAVSWSISTEAFFYLMFPFLILRWNTTWHWKSLIVFLCATQLLWISGALHLPPYGAENALIATSHGIGYISPFTRISEFVIGMVAARAYSAALDLGIFGGRLLWTIAELFSLWLVFVAIHVSHLAVSLASEIIGHPLGVTAWTTFIDNCAGAPAFGVIVVVFAIGRGGLSRALSIRPLILAGEISFSLYLVHQIVLSFLWSHHWLVAAVPADLGAALYFAVVLILAFIFWRIVEIPCRFRLKKALMHLHGAYVQDVRVNASVDRARD